MGAYKHVQCTGTVSAISDAYSALEELGGECREIVDNASEGLSQTQRIQTFEQTADTLENIQEPSIPDCVSELPITYTEAVLRRKRGAVSRAARCENAVSVLQAAQEACATWLEDEENEEHEERDDVETFVQELEEAAGDAEGCEFPGMFG